MRRRDADEIERLSPAAVGHAGLEAETLELLLQEAQRQLVSAGSRRTSLVAIARQLGHYALEVRRVDRLGRPFGVDSERRARLSHDGHAAHVLYGTAVQ